MLGFTGIDGTRRVEPGLFDLMIGESSANIRLSDVVELTGQARDLPADWRMTSHCAATPAAN